MESGCDADWVRFDDADELAKGRTPPDMRCLPGVLRFLGYDPRHEPTTVGQALVRYREGPTSRWLRPMWSCVRTESFSPSC